MTAINRPEIISEAFGDPENPPLLLIMGAMASMLWWPEAFCRELAEKIAQLGSCWIYEVLDGLAFSPTKAAKLMAHGLGQITRMGGASNVRPVESAAP